MAIAHAGVGMALYRDVLVDITGRTLVASIPDRGDKATAFWFMVGGPTLWLGGRLLRSAESSDDLSAQRAAGVVLTATGAIGAAAMPLSGFWAVAAVGVGALRRGMHRQRGSTGRFRSSAV